MKKALITGITGQDGSYLAELLLLRGYEVHGIIRRTSTLNTNRIDHVYANARTSGTKFFLHYGDLTGSEPIYDIIYRLKPDEVYNLAAQSHVRVSFDIPEYTGEVIALGTTRILEAIRKSDSKGRFYQASTSEMFGNVPPPQNEDTPFRPRSPYAIAKLYSYWMAENYKEAYGIHACNGILFNHESPRRAEAFVTRKVTIAIANILAKKQDLLYLGNLGAKRDWGFAPEYVEMMWRILQNEESDNYVIGTGEAHSIEEFVEKAFSYADLKQDKHVKIDKELFRPTEAEQLVADARKAKANLGWDPKIRFNDLVKIMVDADIRKVGLTPFGEGDKILRKNFPKRWWLAD